MIIVSIFAGAIIGCNKYPPPATLKLTPEQARDAIIKLIRANEFGTLGNFSLEEAANTPPREVVHPGSGYYVWSYFHFNLQTGTYTYTQRIFGDGKERPHSNRTYKGEFQLENGSWVATKPAVTVMEG
jgi:hypothetical protein